MGRHESRNHGCSNNANQPRRKYPTEKNRHGIKIIHLRDRGIGRKKDCLKIRSHGHDEDKGANTPKTGNKKSNHEGNRRPHILSLHRLRTFHCQGTSYGGRPDGTAHESSRKKHPHDIGGAKTTSLRQGVHAGNPFQGLNGFHDLPPSHFIEANQSSNNHSER